MSPDVGHPFRSAPDRIRTDVSPLERRVSWPLEDGSMGRRPSDEAGVEISLWITIPDRGATEPASGIEPDPPEYEAGARPIELRGQSVGVHLARRHFLRTVESRFRRGCPRRSSALGGGHMAPSEGGLKVCFFRVRKPSGF